MLDIRRVHRNEYDLDAGKTVAAEGSGEPVIVARAPGRLHLLGEHGNTNSGFYLSAAIDRWLSVAVSQRKDTSLRFYAADLSERKRTTVASLKFRKEDRWANHAKVAVQVFIDMGFPVRGLNFSFSGNIPQNLALASSRAMEVASAVALRYLFKAKIGETELAKRLAATHAAYFEEETGIADYIIGLSARSDRFMSVDEADFSVAKIRSPFCECRIVIADSRVPRLGIEAELDARIRDLASAAQSLSHGRKGANLRDFAEADLIDSVGDLPEKVRRRSLHFVQEAQRVSDACEFLRRGDTQGFSKLVFHSHEGLRDLYEISCPEIDWMVKRAQETPGVFGARMAGEGFGGCTYAIVKDNAVEDYRQRLDDYERIFGFHQQIHEVRIVAGSHIVSDDAPAAQHN